MNSRNRTFLLPLIVALPLFFTLFSLMQGWMLIAIIEDGWNSGNGNVWEALQSARSWSWLLAGVGTGCGIA